MVSHHEADAMRERGRDQVRRLWRVACGTNRSAGQCFEREPDENSDKPGNEPTSSKQK